MATDINTKEVLNHVKTKPQTSSTVELGQNFLRQENTVEDVQEEVKPPSLIARKTMKKYIKLREAGLIKKILNSEYIDKEGSIK